jgi:tetratricopeptide (TPR) repeat protein
MKEKDKKSFNYGARPMFISYRRTDSFAVDQLVQAFHHQFGAAKVIQDVLFLTPGKDFPEELARCITNCRVMVVVIGMDWCGSDKTAIKLSEGDWVRFEIESAIEAKVPLLPILLGDAPIPDKNQLPESLYPLLTKNALKLRTGEDATGDMRKIIAAVGRYMPRDWQRLMFEVAFMLTGVAMTTIGVSLLSSKVFLTSYAPTQWQNGLLGLAFGLILPTLVMWDFISRAWSAKWRQPKPLFRQLHLWIIWVASGVIMLCAMLWPGVNYIDELYRSLESTRDEVPRVSQALDRVRAMPRFADSEHVKFVERALFVRRTKSLTEDQVNSTLNFFAPYRKHSDDRLRLWSTLFSAEAYRFTHQIDLQLKLYGEIATDPQASNWQKWYAYEELGSIYFEKNNRIKARSNWEEALKHLKTRGVLGNLAVLEEDEGNWAKAAQLYQEAKGVLDEYKKRKNLATLADQEAATYANWCNMLRQQANASSQADAPFLREQAVAKCNEAVAAYSPYMDGHWNLARVQLDAKDYIAAENTLRNALNVHYMLSKTDPESLRRFGYAENGEKYTIWLLVVTRYLSNRSLRSDSALFESFRKSVVGLNKDSLTAIGFLISEMEKHELILDEDKEILEQMRLSRYL